MTMSNELQVCIEAYHPSWNTCTIYIYRYVQQEAQQPQQVTVVEQESGGGGNPCANQCCCIACIGAIICLLPHGRLA